MGRLRRLAAVALGLLAGLVGAELLLGACARQVRVTSELEWIADPDVGFRLAPDRFVAGREGGAIHALGLRGPAIDASAPGEHRVLVLGDSFVFGAGVATAEALPAVLEDLAQGPRFVNGGTPSYGTERQARWLLKFGDRIAPDRLLLAVFVGNDFTDNLELEGPAVFAGKLVERSAAGAPDWQLRLRLMRSRSQLWRLWERLDRSAPAVALEGARDVPAGGDDPAARAAFERWRSTEEETFARRQGERLLVYVPEARQPDHIRIAYEAMDMCLDRVQEWCAARGVALGVAILPDVVQVEDHQRALTCKLAGVPLEYPDWDRPQRAIRAWCERRGVPCVDLLPAFRAEGAAGGEASLYLLADSHFNARGHRTAAEVLWRELRAWIGP